MDNNENNLTPQDLPEELPVNEAAEVLEESADALTDSAETAAEVLEDAAESLEESAEISEDNIEQVMDEITENAEISEENQDVTEDASPDEVVYDEFGNPVIPVEEAPKPKKNILKMITSKISEFFSACGSADIMFLRLIGVYFVISSINFISAKNESLNAVSRWKDYVQQVDLTNSILWIISGFAFLTLIHILIPKRFRVIDQFVAFAGTVMFALTVVYRSTIMAEPLFYLSIGLIAVSCVFIAYSIGKIRRTAYEKLPSWAAALIVLAAAVGVTGFVAVTTVSHFKIFGNSTFDMGIFVQMFHSMSTDFSADTTCERDYLLSHFFVHASYIYYILAPIYKLFPSGDTLLIAQAVLAMGGIVPLFLMAKKHGYKGFPLVFMCLIYVFCAGILSPCYYDFHENCFLPTVLMWLLYAVDQKKYILFVIMSVLTCCVKEDAPLYVICIALFLFFEDKKSRKRFIALAVSAASAVYFMLIMKWLTENGDGEMMTSSRFGIVTIDPQEGFVGIIKNVLIDPAYLFSLFVSRRDGANTPEEMLIFVLQNLLPLLFLPFFTKKIRRFLLIIPFVIMNLVVGAGYGYASNIGYQYIFGPIVLMIYMVMINADDFRPSKRNVMVTCSAVASLIMTTVIISGSLGHYDRYKDYQDQYDEVIELFHNVPEELNVACNTWYLPHLANRERVYAFDTEDFNRDPYTDECTTIKTPERYDAYVLSAYDAVTTEPAIDYLVANGYVRCDELENSIAHVIVYIRPELLSTYPSK